MTTGNVMFDTMDNENRKLREAFGRFASGITVVTLNDHDGNPTGITVNSFSSLSLDPPLLLFSVGKSQVSRRWLQISNRFNVNILSTAQEDVAWQFARPVENKFEGVHWRTCGNGQPVIEQALATFECRKWQTYDGGDHDIVVGEVTGFDTSEGDALLFFRGQMARMEKAARGTATDV